jgi:2,3-bisphosphoglycerate-independent phosphoglycerate mutase
MNEHESGTSYSALVDSLAERSDSRILLAIMDGVGDLPISRLGDRTPLEAAETPNMDSLAGKSALGMHVPIARAITPGSGPAHLALFGYDPLIHTIGRGMLAAIGIGLDLRKGDLAARINFCTVDDEGVVTDRRAGRISTRTCSELVELLSEIEIDGVELHVAPVKEHRACVVFRGKDLSASLTDGDPARNGRKPRTVTATNERAVHSAAVVNEFIDRSRILLRDSHPANAILLRGFSLYRPMPTMEERFLLRAGVVALYPMYKGAASLVGMEILPCISDSIECEADSVRKAFSSGFTFVFMHYKPTDRYGEDGNVEAKIRAIEDFDRILPEMLDAGPDVVCITGDHCTPCSMKNHSWHTVPVLIHGGPQRTGDCSRFTERQASRGSLGTFRALELLPLLMAAAGKLRKFGA